MPSSKALRVRGRDDRDSTFEVAQDATFQDIFEAAVLAGGFATEDVVMSQLVVAGCEDTPLSQDNIAALPERSHLCLTGASDYVTVHIDSVKGVLEDWEAHQVLLVWCGLGLAAEERRQTKLVTPDASGTLHYDQNFCVTPPRSEEQNRMSLAVWLVKPGETEAHHQGIANVALSESLRKSPRQDYSFAMNVQGATKQQVTVAFSLASHPSEAVLAASAASAASVAAPVAEAAPVAAEAEAEAATTGLEADEAAARGDTVSEQARSQAGLAIEGSELTGRAAIAAEARTETPPPPTVAAAAADTPDTTEAATTAPAAPARVQINPPVFDPSEEDGRMSTAEFRMWVAEVLSEVRSGLAPALVEANSSSSREHQDVAAWMNTAPLHEALAVHGTPHPLAESVVSILDKPVLLSGAKSSRKTTSVAVAEERLLAAALEVYLNTAEWGPDIAQAVRHNAAGALLALLGLPPMAHRVYSDNGLATSAVVHQMQRFGFLKTHNAPSLEDIKHRSCRAMSVYVGQETHEEWGACDILKQLLWEMPLVEIKCAKAGQNGSLDTVQLEEDLKADIARDVVPVAVVGRMGNGSVDGTDDIPAMAALCERYQMWLHIEGPAVFLLSDEASATSKEVVRIASQGTLNLSIVLCTHETPELRGLQGFWAFSSGSQGTILNPQDNVPETDVAALPCCLPTYLRLRSAGLHAVCEGLEDRIHRAETMVHSLHALKGRDGEVVPKLFTSESNLHNVSFTLLPSGQNSGLSNQQINSSNKMICDMVADPQFNLLEAEEGSEGLAKWHASPLSLTAASWLRFKEIIESTSADVFNVPASAELVSKVFSAVEFLSLVNPAKTRFVSTRHLCSVSFRPPFCEFNKDDESDDDMRAIQASLATALNTHNKHPEVIRFDSSGGAVSCEMVAGASGVDEEHIKALTDLVSTAVDEALRTDRTILKMEAEVLRRGIELARNELEEAAERSEADSSILRSIPLVGSVFGWMAPSSPADEGLKFDLQTSTLMKDIKKK